MRKAATFAGALTLAAAGLVGTTAPAQAVTIYESERCIGYYFGLITTCIDVGWRQQDDGRGASMEFYKVRTPEGCGDLEPSGSKYKNMYMRAYSTQLEGGLVDSDGPRSGDCNFLKDVEVRGADTGSTSVKMQVESEVQGSPNRCIHFILSVRGDGSRDGEQIWIDNTAC